MYKGHSVFCIAAVDQKGGIGRTKGDSWHLKKELAHFKRVTTTVTNPQKQHMVAMGRVTWERIPEKSRPLAGRKNVVLSRNPRYEAPSAFVVHTLQEALDAADETIESIFIVGGADVFAQFITGTWVRDHEILDGVYQTQIHFDFQSDIFFPGIPAQYKKMVLGEDEEDGIRFTYCLYRPDTLDDLS